MMIIIYCYASTEIYTQSMITSTTCDERTLNTYM